MTTRTQKVTSKENKYPTFLLPFLDSLLGLPIGKIQLKARMQKGPVMWSIQVCLLGNRAGWRRVGSGNGGAKRRHQHTQEEHCNSGLEKHKNRLLLRGEHANSLEK